MIGDIDRSSRLYNDARARVDKGDLDAAVPLLEQSISDYPHFKTLELLGECYQKIGRLQDAVIPLAAAVTLNKGSRAAAILATVLLELKEYKQAEDIADVALQRAPTNRIALRVKELLLKRQ